MRNSRLLALLAVLLGFAGMARGEWQKRKLDLETARDKETRDYAVGVAWDVLYATTIKNGAVDRFTFRSTGTLLTRDELNREGMEAVANYEITFPEKYSGKNWDFFFPQAYFSAGATASQDLDQIGTQVGGELFMRSAVYKGPANSPILQIPLPSLRLRYNRVWDSASPELLPGVFGSKGYERLGVEIDFMLSTTSFVPTQFWPVILDLVYEFTYSQDSGRGEAWDSTDYDDAYHELIGLRIEADVFEKIHLKQILIGYQNGRKAPNLEEENKWLLRFQVY